MARIRTIKPQFFFNEDLAKLPFQARLLFIGLWTLCDREGFVEYRPAKIRAEIFPYERINVQKLLDQLTDSFIEVFLIGDKKYIHVINFCKHQVINVRENKSTVPEQYWNSTGTVPELQEGKGRERKGTVKQEEEEKEKEKEPPPPPDFDKFYISSNKNILNYQDTLTEFLQLDAWHTKICSEFKIDQQFLIDDMKKFLLDQNNQDQFPRELSDTKRHYHDALKKFLKSKSNTKSLGYVPGQKKK